MSDAVPAQARVVVIGGGIAGCSVAYHLAKLGWRDVVLLERRELSCGTTWHAAGLVGQLRATHNLTRLAKYGADLYERLEAETGQATGFRRPGSLSLARNAERMHELARLASMARCFDVDVEVITPAEAGRRWPLLRTDDLAGAVWLPRDGRTNPIDTTLALAKGARQGGVTILENTAVTAIRTRGGAVAGVGTPRGDIACEVVVNCAGMWARDLGAMAGVAVPLHASEHFYIVTEPMDGVTADLPVLRDPDGHIYVREEVGGLLMGGFEPVAKPWGMEGIPADFCLLAPARGLGSLPGADGAGDRPHPRDRVGAGAQPRQRAGELHAGRPLPPRRGARVQELLRRRGLQLDRHRLRGGRRQGGGGVDRGRRAPDGPLGRGHPPRGAVSGQSRVPARAHRGDGRPAVRHALALPAAGDRARRAEERAARPARRARRLLRPGHGLGAARTGTRRRARSPSIATAGDARTGSPGPPRSIARCARTSGSSTSRRSPS